jgi:hypothetical protein
MAIGSMRAGFVMTGMAVTEAVARESGAESVQAPQTNASAAAATESECLRSMHDMTRCSPDSGDEADL